MNLKYLLSIFLIIIISSSVANSQNIKLVNGLLLNSYSNELDLDILKKNRISYLTKIGVDYLKNDRFYLSSEIGYLEMRGRENYNFGLDENKKFMEKASYVHSNTTFRYIVLRKKFSQIFLGAGPYINILLGDNFLKSEIYKDFYKYNRFYWGGKPEIGFINKLNDKFYIGLVGEYMFNLTPSINSEGVKLNNTTYSFSMTVNYNLK